MCLQTVSNSVYGGLLDIETVNHAVGCNQIQQKSGVVPVSDCCIDSNIARFDMLFNQVVRQFNQGNSGLGDDGYHNSRAGENYAKDDRQSVGYTKEFVNSLWRRNR